MAQRVGRDIALLFHDRGTRRGWMVSGTPRPHFTPGKDPVPIVQEAGWAPGPVWTCGKSRPYRDSIPDRAASSQSLYHMCMYRVIVVSDSECNPSLRPFRATVDNAERSVSRRRSRASVQCIAGHGTDWRYRLTHHVPGSSWKSCPSALRHALFIAPRTLNLLAPELFF